MKTFLNILSPEKKKDILLAKRYHTFVSQGMGVLFLFIFFGMLLSGVWGLLLFNEKIGNQDFEKKKQGNSSYEDILSYEQTFSRVQEKIPRVENVLQSQRIGSRIFRALEGAVSTAGAFSSVNISDDTVKVSGRSATRDGLLELQENLRKQPCFSDAVLPWSQMAQKENIDFEITIPVRPECFSLDITY